MARHPFKKSGQAFTARQRTGRYKPGSEPVSGRLVGGLVEYFYDMRDKQEVLYPVMRRVDTLTSLLRPHIDEAFSSQDLLDAVVLQLTMNSGDIPVYDAHSLLDPLVMALHSYDYNNFHLDLTTLAPYQADLAKGIGGKEGHELSVSYKCNVVSFGRAARFSRLEHYGEVYLGAYAGVTSTYVFHGPVAFAGPRAGICDIYLQSGNSITPNPKPAAVLRFDHSDIYSAADMRLMDKKCTAWESNFYVAELGQSDKERLTSTFFSQLGNQLHVHRGECSWEKVALE